MVNSHIKGLMEVVVLMLTFLVRKYGPSVGSVGEDISVSQMHILIMKNIS